jgi:hypothetical protein
VWYGWIMVRRRLLIPLVSALVSVTAATTVSCSPGAVPESTQTPLPTVPFSEVMITETGGIDGRHDVLLIETDGVALRMSSEPSAGMIGEAALARLRILLESEQFRREVATQPPPEPPSCSDQITMTVRMGPLQMSRTGPCPDGGDRATPAFDEILKLTSAPLQGTYAGPVPAGPPELLPVRLEADKTAAEPGYVITMDARGRGTMARPGAQVRRTLAREAQDTLRLLLDRLAAAPVVECAQPGRRRAVIGSPDKVVVRECDAFGSQPEFSAMVGLLEQEFAAR